MSTNFEKAYKRRLKNFNMAYEALKQDIESKELCEFSQLELLGLMKRFEYAFELCWHTFNDYLFYCGVSLVDTAPENIFKEFINLNINKMASFNPVLLKEMITTRDDMPYMCDTERFMREMSKIKEVYVPEFKKMLAFVY